MSVIPRHHAISMHLDKDVKAYNYSSWFYDKFKKIKINCISK